MLFLREFWQHRRLFLLNILSATLALSLLLSVNVFSKRLLNGLQEEMNKTGLSVNCLQLNRPCRADELMSFTEEYQIRDYVMFHQMKHDVLQIGYGDGLEKLFVFDFKEGGFSISGAVLGQEAWKYYGCPQISENIEIDGAVFQVSGILQKDCDNVYFNCDEMVLLPDCFNPQRSYEQLFFNSERSYFRDYLDRQFGADGYVLLQQKTLQRSLSSLTSLAARILLGLSLFCVFISLLSLLTSTLSSLKSRYHEIGIKKALGASDRDIYRQFIGESLIVLLLSSILSALISVAIRKMTGAADDPAMLQSECFYLMLVNLCGVLTSLYPAYKASKISVIRAIRN